MSDKFKCGDVVYLKGQYVPMTYLGRNDHEVTKAERYECIWYAESKKLEIASLYPDAIEIRPSKTITFEQNTARLPQSEPRTMEFK